MCDECGSWTRSWCLDMLQGCTMFIIAFALHCAADALVLVCQFASSTGSPQYAAGEPQISVPCANFDVVH